jgi:hypothetical protein
MAKINSEMDALLTYAEQKGLCLWQYDPGDKNEIGAIDCWEDLLWDPRELRQALINHQPQVGRSHTAYSSPYDLTDFNKWRIVNLHDIVARYEQAIRDAEAEVEEMRKAARYFKEIWIDKTASLEKKTLLREGESARGILHHRFHRCGCLGHSCPQVGLS